MSNSIQSAKRKVMDKMYATDLMMKKDGYARRWSKKMLKEAQLVSKIKMNSGSGEAKKGWKL